MNTTANKVSNPWNPFSYPPGSIVKALYGFTLPGVTAMGAAYSRAAISPEYPVTKFDWIAAGVAMFITGGGVFYAKNKSVSEARSSTDNGL